MKAGQNLYSLTADVIVSMKPILEILKPDYVFVHGDTTTQLQQHYLRYAGLSVPC
jgi:UDP-N-acetylglucosamine 2-epimerase (non-hydrolysing)